MEEEAEPMYREEHGLLLDDDAASTRDAMYLQNPSDLNVILILLLTFSFV